MSRNRDGVAFKTYIGGGEDPGGTLFNPNGSVFREAPVGATDGYTTAVTIGPGAGLASNRVRSNDMIVLCHVTSSTAGSGLGQPTNLGNPWLPVRTTDGTAVNFTAAGPTGSLRLRMWWKWADFDDAVTTRRYSISNSFASMTNLFYSIIPRESFATDPAYDGPLGNGHLPPPYVPVAAGVRIAAGGNRGAPPLTAPNVGAKPRNVGIVGAVVAHAESSNSYNIRHAGNANRFASSYQPFVHPYFTPLYWAENSGYLPGGGGSTQARGYLGFTQVKLDGRRTEQYYNYSNIPDIGRQNDAFISLTLSIIRPYDYPLPTPDKTVADLRDTFETGALSERWLLGTNRADQALPDVVDGKLRLRGEQQIVHRYRVDLTAKAVVIGPIDYPLATESGSNFWFTLNSAVDDVIHQVQIAMFTKGFAGGAEIRWAMLDEGFFAQPSAPGDPRSYVGAWDAAKTRYWRIREGAGLMRFEVSPDKLRWTGAYWSHNYSPDQLRALQIHMYLLGEAEVTIDEVQPVVPPDLRPIPYEPSWTFMGAPPELRERLHGRDVLVGIADQGTTAAMRAAQNVTMTRRLYVAPQPGGDKEIHDFAVHGCLVTPCGVPSGGRFVEAVISGSEGTSTASIMMAGLLWLARQGAKVLNLSFGGGGDDPIFDAVFSYIAANFDCQIFIASGNDYSYGISLPAGYCVLYSNVHAVIAWDEALNIRAPFSNHHELSNGAAPGRYVGGRLPDGSPVLWNGTSAASPHAAQLCVRGQTGARYSSAQTGAALDRGTRDTGQPISEHGGGAYDLTRALGVIGDPAGIANIPAIAMPRFEQGQWAGVTAGLNEMVAAVEAQGRACLVRYAGRGYAGDGTLVETNASIASGVYGVVPWTSCDADTYAGMWDGSPVVTIPADGVYVVVLHLRYGSRYIDQATGNTVTATGAPYNAGLRGGLILLNGTDVNANTVVADRVSAALDSDGATVVLTALLPLKTDDFLYAQTWQTSGATIQCLQNDYGGNWMLVARVAPLAPDLTGSLDPVTNFTALSTRFDQVTVAWTPPPTTDLVHVLIRRKTGSTAPTSITDGDYVDSVKRGTTRFLDTKLASNATYSYAAFARSPGGYSPRAVATVTTSVKPAAPAPVTNVTSSRRTTGNIALTWTLPPNPDGNGVPRAGIQVRRNEGSAPPLIPEGGVLVATLPPDATGFDDTTVVANGKTYGYSIFTFRSEQVFSPPVTHTRSTAINTTIFGNYRPGDILSANFNTMYGVPIGQDNFVVMPSFTAVRYYGSIIVGQYFWVRRPALFKGHRFLRPKPNIGTVKAALYRFGSATFEEPYGTKIGPQKAFGQTAAFTTWEEAILREQDGGYIPLTPYQIYINVTMFPSDIGEVAGFFAPGGLGERGLTDPNGLLVVPATYGNYPGDKELWKECLGTYRPVDGNNGGSAFFDTYYEGDLFPTVGTLDAGFQDAGRCFYTDVIVNEI